MQACRVKAVYQCMTITVYDYDTLVEFLNFTLINALQFKESFPLLKRRISKLVDLFRGFFLDLVSVRNSGSTFS